ncbi:hypothetical protein MTO96_043611 [Rhipicephalus appendiculatus]
MFHVRLLWVVLLQVFHSSTAATIVNCPPGNATDTAPVKHCNYYCGQTPDGTWRMGYYVNGTACEYDYEDKKGICAVVDGYPGCYWHKDPDVEKFLKSEPKVPKTPKKPKKKKPKKSTTTTKSPKKKKPKKPKKSSKNTKTTKKSSRQTLPDQPKW